MKRKSKTPPKTQENWMGDLDKHLRNLPIIYLAIPGTHNSMTYGITHGAKMGPDSDDRMRFVNGVLPMVMRNWSRTQDSNIERQLELGVRYFDLRMGKHKNKYYYCHGLLAMEFSGPLTQMRRFLDKHPREVVILDFQHFYAMQSHDHRQLQLGLLKLFADIMFQPTDGPLNECTLNICENLTKQIIIIYRNRKHSMTEYFWTSDKWPTPWPNVTTFEKLTNYLNDALQDRQPTCGYVSQCIITPTGAFLALRMCSSLRATAKKLNHQMYRWIKSQRPGPFGEREHPNINVILGDFVEHNNGDFCNWVIDLNNKIDFKEDEEEEELDGDKETISTIS